MADIVSKLDAARRQLDTAIDLWFAEADSVPVLALAFASFRISQNLHKRKGDSEFGKKIDELIEAGIGWKKFTEAANFLKHADQDPDADMDFHPDLGMPIMGLAVLLYKHLAPDGLTLRMKAFDAWVETTAADELEIAELDNNPKRAAHNRRERARLKALPREAFMAEARAFYKFFLENHDRLAGEVAKAASTGVSFQHLLDSQLPIPKG